MVWTRARPSPAPGRERASSARWKRSVALGRKSAGMPSPASVTVMTTTSSVRRTVRSIGGRPWMRALGGRFERAQHVVEGVAEAGDLVVAGGGDVEADASGASRDGRGLGPVALDRCEGGLGEAFPDDGGDEQGAESGDRQLGQQFPQ